jgi:hypothetical protein
MEERGYESEVANHEIRVRYAARRTGFPQRYARILASCQNDPQASWDLAWTANIDRRYDQVSRTANLAQCCEMLDRATADPDYRFLYLLDAAISLCPRPDLPDLLRQQALPAFFQRFPAGRVIFIGTDSSFESRLATLRIGNFIQINGANALADMRLHGIHSTNTAEAIQSSGVVALDKAMMAMLGNFMPLKTHLVGGRIGLRMIYLFGDAAPQVIDRGPFPRDDADLFGSQIFYRGDDPDLSSPAAPLEGWRGRFRNTGYLGDNALEQLIQFLLERFNWHVENRAEACNFVDGQTVDFIACFEKYLTIDRIFYECVMIASTTNSAVARLMTFAILDKFQELCRFPGVPPDRQFHYMCTRPFLTGVLQPALALLPAPWDRFFIDRSTALYDDLYAAVRSSQGVWPNYLVQAGGGVRVYRRWDRKARQFVDLPAPMGDDDFIEEYVRSARNTHHGYISDGDNRRRFACFGSISTAFIPDSFTQLPLLILLGEIVAPQRFSGHHWLDQASLALNV